MSENTASLSSLSDSEPAPAQSAIRVGILGANGRMGSAAVSAVQQASGLELAAALGRGDDLRALVENAVDVVVDLTIPDASEENVLFAVDHGIHAVVGTSGWTPEKQQRLSAKLSEHPGLGVFIAPNFALGAIFAMKSAELAAAYFESVEIVELHHPKKLDAPSGTAVHTAHLVSEVRKQAGVPNAPDATEKSLPGARGADVAGVPVHSVRLQGLVAHEEILLGNPGEQLTIRHDSFNVSSFMPGIILGIRKVVGRPGLTVGLDKYLDL